MAARAATAQPAARRGAGPAPRRSALYEQLRDQIVAGTLAPGTHLVETALAEANGVSRTPIREALRRLEQDGLVEHFERGLRVRQRGPEEILEVYEVRIVLEATVARAAAERHRDFDRLRLTKLLDRMRQVPLGDVAAMAECNRSFHEAIWQASQNRTLIDVLKRLAVHLYRYPYSTYTNLDRWPSALAEHERLVEAILARDGQKAAEIAAEHMTAARDVRIAMWQDDPEFTAD
jgi:DNA-binding GntR family transcriptional regulator